MSRTWCLLLLAFACCCLAQEGPSARSVSELELEVKQAVPVANEQWDAIIWPVRCDADERVYVRIDETGNFRGGPILGISPDGQKVTRFSTNQARGLEQAPIVDFALGRNGEVYFLAQTKSDAFHILRFDRDGKLEGVLPLHLDFRPEQFAVFGSGDFLIAGEVQRPAGSGEPDKPTVALVDANGKFLKAVTLTEDVAEGATASGTPAPKQSAYRQAMDLTDAEAGDDGSIFLMRHTPQGPVYQISAAGEIVRKLVLRPPERAYLSAIKVGRGRLVAEFLQRKEGSQTQIAKVTLSVYDSTTGEETARYYHASGVLGSALACFKSSVFTFLSTTSSGRLQLVQAGAR